MLLTPTELKYIELGGMRAEGLTYEEIHERTGASTNTIARAQDYCAKNTIYNYEGAKILRQTIARLRKHQRWLERKLKEHERVITERKKRLRRGEKIKGLPALPVNTISVFSTRLVEVEMQIAKLEGLYEETLNVHHSGSVDSAVRIYIPGNDRDNGD